MNPCITRPAALSPHQRHQLHQPRPWPYRRRWPWEQAENERMKCFNPHFLWITVPFGKLTFEDVFPIGNGGFPLQKVSLLEGKIYPISLGYKWDPLALCWLHSFSFHVGIFCSVTLKQFMLNCELLTALESPEFAGWIGIVDFEGPIDLSCNQFGKNDFE